MIDATRQLRWYFGLAVLVLAFMPTVGFTGLATKTYAPPDAFLPVLVGGPFNVVGTVFVVLSMTTSNPSKSSRWLGIGTAAVILGVGSMVTLASTFVY